MGWPLSRSRAVPDSPQFSCGRVWPAEQAWLRAAGGWAKEPGGGGGPAGNRDSRPHVGSVGAGSSSDKK